MKVKALTPLILKTFEADAGGNETNRFLAVPNSVRDDIFFDFTGDVPAFRTFRDAVEYWRRMR